MKCVRHSWHIQTLSEEKGNQLYRSFKLQDDFAAAAKLCSKWFWNIDKYNKQLNPLSHLLDTLLSP